VKSARFSEPSLHFQQLQTMRMRTGHPVFPGTVRSSVLANYGESKSSRGKLDDFLSRRGPPTNGLSASKKRSSRRVSCVMPMRTVVMMCAVSRTAVPSQSGPLAHRSTPSNRWSICNAAARRPGPLAKSMSLSVLRSRFIRLIPSRGSMARNSTPAPTPGSPAVTLSMYDVP